MVTETRYFIVDNAAGFKSSMLSKKTFPVEKLDPKFVKETDAKLTADAVQIEKERAEAAKEEPNEITPIVSTELAPEFNFQTKEIGTLPDGKKIVHALIPGYLQKRFDNLTNRKDKYTGLWLYDVGFDGQYAGRTRADVLKKFPDMVGKLLYHNWSGQEVELQTAAELKWIDENTIDTPGL